jgi:hypothetical protein
VSGQQDDEPPWAGFPGGRDETAGDDVLELGAGRPDARRWPAPSWWPPKVSRFAAILAAVTLVVGLGLGYAAGARHGGGGTTGGSAAGVAGGSAQPVSVGGPTLAQSGNRCSAQHGTTLQLGVQVSNESGTPLTLGEVRVVLPMGGLRMTAVTWGPCGELPTGSEDPPQSDATDRYLPPGASGWLTVTVSVMVACPGPLPIQFMVGYEQHGKLSTVQLPGFADLGSVPYPGCPQN